MSTVVRPYASIIILIKKGHNLGSFNLHGIQSL